MQYDLIYITLPIDNIAIVEYPPKKLLHSDNPEEVCISGIFKLPNTKHIDSKYMKVFIENNPILMTYESLKGLNSYIGVEVEIENVISVGSISQKLWHSVEDGSLRNGGIEFKTPGVIRVKYIEYALRNLFQNLNPDIDFSIRTSIHVHQDVRGMTLKQFLCLILTYLTVENIGSTMAVSGAHI